MSQNRSFFAGFRIEWFHIETTLVEIMLITFPLLEFFFVEVALRLEIQIFFLEKLYVLMYDTSIYNVEEMYKNICSKTKIYFKVQRKFPEWNCSFLYILLWYTNLVFGMFSCKKLHLCVMKTGWKSHVYLKMILLAGDLTL